MRALVLCLIILVFFIKLVSSAIETKEKELFKISTANSTTYIQFDVAENKNQYNYLFIQIIFCRFLVYDSHINIETDMGEVIFSTDVISSRNLVLNITEQINNSLIINATSSDMYVQYQYLKEDNNVIFATGFINNYDFGNNYISFHLSPVVNNIETTYDLYYLGKINIHNDICQKVSFILENDPISSITIKGYNYFDLKFEDIEHKTGYYLIKGNNVNDVSYYYFYEFINVINKIGPFKTNSSEFFEVKSESDVDYYIFTTPGNPDRKKYFNFQVILCNHYGDQKSQISIFNENNVEIFFNDIIESFQDSIELRSYTNITIMATSPHMYIQYQFIDIDIPIKPYGLIESYYSNLDYHYIQFKVTSLSIDTSSYHELYFEKNLTLISDECSKLVYSLNNKLISNLNALADSYYTDLNFTYNLNGDGQNENGFAFIKTKNINEINYTYFYEEVNLTINYNNDSKKDDDDDSNNNNDNVDDGNKTLFTVLAFILFGILIIGIFVVIFIMYKQGICSKEKSDDNPNSISLINRMSE